MFQARMYNRAPVAPFVGAFIEYRGCFIRQVDDAWQVYDEQKRTLVVGRWFAAAQAEGVIDSVLEGKWPGGRCKNPTRAA